MTRLSLAIVVLLSLPIVVVADTFGTGENQFEIEFVEIGNPGNAADTTGRFSLGSVDYNYKLGRFEVSRVMVEKANAEGGLSITMHAMDFVSEGPRPDMAVTGVSWNEAARFTNWLNTSQGFPAAYKFNTQPGEAGYDANADIELWVDGDLGFDASNPFRNSQAQFFLPSADEWHKAAYYDPANGGYWDFPTGSDIAPTGVASGTDPDTAVYLQENLQGPADIMQAGGLSPYGVMGLGGNVYEWEETAFGLLNGNGTSWRGMRSGMWFGDSEFLSASSRSFSEPPTTEAVDVGFRVASIPEPSSLLLGLFGMLALMIRHLSLHE